MRKTLFGIPYNPLNTISPYSLEQSQPSPSNGKQHLDITAELENVRFSVLGYGILQSVGGAIRGTVVERAKAVEGVVANSTAARSQSSFEHYSWSCV